MTAAACDEDRSGRRTPRATGRALDEPFADLHVMAGRSAETSRLYALDLLNLELEPVVPGEEVSSLIGRCGRRTIVEVQPATGPAGLRALEDDALTPVPADVMADPRCSSVLAGEDAAGWLVHDTAPNGRRTFLTRGRQAAVAPAADLGAIRILGRTRLPVQAAVWVAR